MTHKHNKWGRDEWLAEAIQPIIWPIDVIGKLHLLSRTWTLIHYGTNTMMHHIVNEFALLYRQKPFLYFRHYFAGIATENCMTNFPKFQGIM